VQVVTWLHKQCYEIKQTKTPGHGS